MNHGNSTNEVSGAIQRCLDPLRRAGPTKKMHRESRENKRLSASQDDSRNSNSTRKGVTVPKLKMKTRTHWQGTSWVMQEVRKIHFMSNQRGNLQGRLAVLQRHQEAKLWGKSRKQIQLIQGGREDTKNHTLQLKTLHRRLQGSKGTHSPNSDSPQTLETVVEGPRGWGHHPHPPPGKTGRVQGKCLEGRVLIVRRPTKSSTKRLNCLCARIRRRDPQSHPSHIPSSTLP